ncbi:MAG: hypothetical protein HOP29_09510 [Phycisphaerales bacterium]|nr:hypothetical protein [Phycisphaerales bacterium]
MTVITFWLLARPEAQVAAAQRGLSETTVAWQCPNGHRFQRVGGHVAIPCESCDRKANVAVTYECPRDGRMEALARYERLPSGGGKLTEVSFRPGVWTGVDRTVHCPVCGVRLRPAGDDVLGRLNSPPNPPPTESATGGGSSPGAGTSEKEPGR